MRRGTQYGLDSDPKADWRSGAACRREGVDPEWFWPEEGNSHAAAVALHVCRIHCPVRHRCDREEGPKVTHPQVVGGRRYTTVGGGSHGLSRHVAESRITEPSAAGCPFCPPQPQPAPQLRRADCPECGRNIGLMPWGVLARHQPRKPSMVGTPRCLGTGRKP